MPELEPIFVQTVTSTNRYLPVSRTARCLMNVCRSPSLLSLFFLATACSSDPAGPPPAGDGNAEVEWVAIATGLSDPIFLTAPSGDPRLFVALQGGVIRIIDNGQELSTSFIDINNQVQSGGERGLLGVAFHPDYAANGYVYLHSSDNNGDTQVDRFTVSSNVNVLSVGSQTPIISVPQPFSNHNGGMLAFGVDGMLYLALGAVGQSFRRIGGRCRRGVGVRPAKPLAVLLRFGGGTYLHWGRGAERVRRDRCGARGRGRSQLRVEHHGRHLLFRCWVLQHERPDPSRSRL